MAERHDAERSVAQARERLTRLAEELSRRATGDYVKTQARAKAGQLTSRARVVARERTIEMKDRVMDNPWALGLIGGGVGALAGKLIGDRAKARQLRSGKGYETYRYDETPRFYGQQQYDQYSGQPYPAGYQAQGYSQEYYGGYQDRPYDEYTATHQPGELITEDRIYGLDQQVAGAEQPQSFGAEPHEGKAQELKHKASEKLSQASEKVREAGANLRERIPSGGAIKEGVRERLPSGHEMRGRARDLRATMSDRPELWGLAALAVGAIFGALVPVSNRERRVLGPVKSDAAGRIEAAKEEVASRARSFKEGVQQGLHEEPEARGEGRFPRGQGEEAGTAGFSAGSEVGGYGSDSGYSAAGGSAQEGAATYSAGGSSEDEKREQGFHSIPEPDVTRH